MGKYGVGNRFKTNEGYAIEVIEKLDDGNRIIIFLDDYGYEKEVNYVNIKCGKIKNPYHKSVYGIGYLGGNEIDGVAKEIWKSMMQRAYNPKFHEKQPTYKEVEVDERWHNCQVFVEDIEKMPGYSMFDENGRVYQLDKDILVKGNKVYSKDTCVFVPCAINSFMINNRSDKGDLPTGVCWDKQNNKYISQIKINGKKKHLGSFTNVEDARAIYVAERNKYASYLAEKYEGKVDPRVIDILNNWNEEEHSE